MAYFKIAKFSKIYSIKVRYDQKKKRENFQNKSEPPKSNQTFLCFLACHIRC